MSMVHCAWTCSSSLADQPALQFLEALARGDQRGQDGRHLGRAVDRSGRLDRAPDGVQLAQFALGQLHAVHVSSEACMPPPWVKSPAPGGARPRGRRAGRTQEPSHAPSAMDRGVAAAWLP
jgi:hypothetical protein